MTTITQAEYDKLFGDYIRKQKFDGVDRDRWFCNHVFKFNKKMTEEGIDICAGFYVNEVGERVDE